LAWSRGKDQNDLVVDAEIFPGAHRVRPGFFKRDDRWGPSSATGGEGEVTDSGMEGVGPRAIFGRRPDSAPMALLLFS
jgi:hypothetical protein